MSEGVELRVASRVDEGKRERGRERVTACEVRDDQEALNNCVSEGQEYKKRGRGDGCLHSHPERSHHCLEARFDSRVRQKEWKEGRKEGKKGALLAKY